MLINSFSPLFNGQKPEISHQNLIEPRPNQPGFTDKTDDRSSSSHSINASIVTAGKSTHIQHSAEIQIETQEGDVITINLVELFSQSRMAIQANHQESFHAPTYSERGYYAATRNREGRALSVQSQNQISAYVERRTQASAFNISIEGNLNKDEQKALAKLINTIAKISHQFFQGDLGEVFKQAQKIGFDNHQIKGFSMALNSQKSIKGIAAYQKTAQSINHQEITKFKQAQAFLTESQSALANVSASNALKPFAQPQQVLTDLFIGVGQLLTEIQLNDTQALDKPPFLNMIESIKDNQLQPLN